MGGSVYIGDEAVRQMLIWRHKLQRRKQHHMHSCPRGKKRQLKHRKFIASFKKVDVKIAFSETVTIARGASSQIC